MRQHLLHILYPGADDIQGVDGAFQGAGLRFVSGVLPAQLPRQTHGCSPGGNQKKSDAQRGPELHAG
ncbi:hypothetical protein ACM7OK_02985 [Escherichia coli]